MKKTVILLLAAGAGLLRADPFEQARQDAPIRAYGPNYGAVAVDHGEARVQYQVSLQYGLIPLGALDWGLAGYRLQGLDLAYEGLFDLYLWTRASQPLISRRHNPSVFFSLGAREGQRWAHLDALELGWSHESNGQVADSLAELIAAGRRGADQVSRAWDYWHLASRFSFQPAEQLRISFKPSVRIYTGSQGVLLPAEQDIFWRPQDPPSYIYDYDGLRVELSAEGVRPQRMLNYWALSGSLRTGYNAGHFAERWSSRSSLTVKTWHLPWFFFYDCGYGTYISQYSTWGEGWGLGLRFWG